MPRLILVLVLVLCSRLAAQQDIRHVDFKNFTYPLSGHLLGHSSLEWLDTPAHPTTNRKTVHLADGSQLTKTSSIVVDGTEYGQYEGFTFESVSYGDIIGDGHEEAIVVLMYHTGERRPRITCTPGLADQGHSRAHGGFHLSPAMVGIRSILAGVICLSLGIPCGSQPAAVTPQTVADLNADRWTVRRNAFEHLVAEKEAIDNPRIQDLLIQLREKENVESNKGDADLFEDDDYLAYDQELTPLIQKIAVNTNNPKSWKALVYERYNGDSVFGNWLANHRAALPFLIRRLESPNAPLRMDAVYVVANMLAKAKSADPFPPAEYRSLKQRIHSAAAKGNPAVRQSAIQGLALTKDIEDVPFLEKLAKAAADPDTRQFALAAARQVRDSNH